MHLIPHPLIHSEEKSTRERERAWLCVWKRKWGKARGIAEGWGHVFSLIAPRADGSKVSRVSLLMAYVRATFLEGFCNVNELMSPEAMRGTHPTTPHNTWLLQRCQLTKTDHTLSCYDIIPCDVHNQLLCKSHDFPSPLKSGQVKIKSWLRQPKLFQKLNKGLFNTLQEQWLHL